MNTLPAIFLSHGAPDLPIREGPVVEFLQSVHQQFPKPKAILVISSHWNSDAPIVSKAVQPETMYDYDISDFIVFPPDSPIPSQPLEPETIFPEVLYQLSYPAPGAPDLADRVVSLLAAADIPCDTNPSRGLDHGAWTPLMLAYPAADIPVTQLSIQYQQGPLHHWKVGQALEPLRHEGVLIVGSGTTTHNIFYALDKDYEAEPPSWVQEFDEWLAKTIADGNWEALLQYRQLAPYAVENHPTEEHFLPLFAALGAGGTAAKGTQLHRSYTYSVLSMTAYEFA